MTYSINDYREDLDHHPSRMDTRRLDLINFTNSSATRIAIKLYPSELRKLKRDYPNLKFKLIKQYSGISQEGQYLIRK